MHSRPHGVQHTAAAARAAARAESSAFVRSPPVVRTADGQSCRTASTQSTHVSTRGTSEGPGVRMTDGQSCRTVSTQSTHVSTRGTSEGPVVRIADGQACHTAAQCGAPTHAPPMRGACVLAGLDCAAKSAAAVPREAYLSIKVPLTRLDPVHPIDAEPPQPLKGISSWFDRGPRPGAIRTATM